MEDYAAAKQMLGTYTNLHAFKANKRSLVNVGKESHDNFTSPLMKTLDKSVETLGLNWIVSFEVAFISSQNRIKPRFHISIL